MEFEDLDPLLYYRLLAPRPTIIVTTTNKKGHINAAPFSFTMPVSMKPPLIAIASVKTHHTYQNIQETHEFVVNIPHTNILSALWTTGEKFPEEVNEVKEAGLTSISSSKVQPPSISECIANFECKLKSDHEMGDHQLIVGEVINLRARGDALDNGLLRVEEMKPLLHLGGKDFVVGDNRTTITK